MSETGSYRFMARQVPGGEGTEWYVFAEPAGLGLDSLEGRSLAFALRNPTREIAEDLARAMNEQVSQLRTW